MDRILARLHTKFDKLDERKAGGWAFLDRIGQRGQGEAQVLIVGAPGQAKGHVRVG